MHYIGIDPGQSGGLALVTPTIASAVPMPLHPKEVQKAWGSPIDWMSMYQLLSQWEAPGATVTVELVHAMPKQGVSSMFRFGGNFTGILAILQALGCTYALVPPRTWKRNVLGDEYDHDKAGAVAFCTDNYPDCNLLATSRSRVPHDGMADALCLAHYGKCL